MGIYFYNCVECGNAQMEDVPFHHNGVVCHHCGSWGSDMAPRNNRVVPKMMRVSFKCDEKLDWSKVNADPSKSFGGGAKIATAEQIQEYVDRTQDPYFATTNGISEGKMPYYDPTNHLLWTKGPLAAAKKKETGMPDGYEEVAEELGQYGYGYKATEKLLAAVKAET